MAGNGVQEKIDLVGKKFFQKPKAMLHDFFAKPEQANKRKKENEDDNFFDVGKIFKPGEKKIDEKRNQKKQ